MDDEAVGPPRVWVGCTRPAWDARADRCGRDRQPHLLVDLRAHRWSWRALNACTIRGLSTEVPVGTANGLDHDSVVSCDNIVTVPVSALGRQLDCMLTEQETALTEAIRAAFDLD